MIPERTILRLLAVAIILPIALVLALATGRLLAAMGDAGGALVLDRLTLVAGIVWLVDLIVLLVALAVRAVGDDNGE